MRVSFSLANHNQHHLVDDSLKMSEPFKIDIPQEALEQLKSKLAAVRFPDELDESGWDYGVPLSEIKRLVSHWTEGFDWKSQEKKLNETLPQFTRDVKVEGHGTLNLHFVHKPSEVVGAVPILIIHGCKHLAETFHFPLD